jgi:hypothetical protein
MAFIPKGVLESLGKRCFKFLWTGERKKEGIPLVKWQILAKPKDEGGWGLKNAHHFR